MTTAVKPPGNNARARIEEQIADRIIKLLDEGNLPPWEQGWTPISMRRNINAESKRPYRGINCLLTALARMERDYQDHRWLTFNQAKKLGGTVRKGEKGTRIIFWKTLQPTDYEDEPEEAGPSNPEPRRRTRTPLLLREYAVFNAEQTQGCSLDPLEQPGLRNHDPIEAAEALIRNMRQKPSIRTWRNFAGPPYYLPRTDEVKAPDISLYKTPETWYSTIFHELVHSTGHPSRLNRFNEEETRQELHGYGKEEMVAGMGAAMLSGIAGIIEETVLQDAGYVKSWRDQISADKGMVIRAASLAQKAVDFITGNTPGEAAKD